MMKLVNILALLGGSFFILFLSILSMTIDFKKSSLQTESTKQTNLDEINISEYKNYSIEISKYPEYFEFMNCNVFGKNDSNAISQFLLSDVKDYLSWIFGGHGDIVFLNYTRSNKILNYLKSNSCKPIKLFCKEEFEMINIDYHDKLWEYRNRINPDDVVCERYECFSTIVKPLIPLEVLKTCFSGNKSYYNDYLEEEKIRMWNNTVTDMKELGYKIKMYDFNFKKEVKKQLKILAKNQPSKINVSLALQWRGVIQNVQDFFQDWANFLKKPKDTQNDDFEETKNILHDLLETGKYRWKNYKAQYIYKKLIDHYFIYCMTMSYDIQKSQSSKNTVKLCCDKTSETLSLTKLKDLITQQNLTVTKHDFEHCKPSIPEYASKVCIDSYYKTNNQEDEKIDTSRITNYIGFVGPQKREHYWTSEYEAIKTISSPDETIGNFFLCNNNH
ncbi:hypothetical protein EDEG_01307 [Edhazardia aedis USNM 41457]|uniref:Uncharacterized protein n=1 Tax=Edhazardia aedis (strain USNM 41457) TaxID=1003232 RepID=J9DSZ4_EDHAE|nr:hypothetical protein EDEG_01307 [Edhazardia aedis USNM 41457]|eukprot:EJW04437.1 hypothetical protein EDEG_01307 [Edhazardia aedis USNM 41457]